MGWLLTATTFGAVVGPNLLQPSTAIGHTLGLRSLTGPYVIALLGFAFAAWLLWCAPARTAPASVAPHSNAGWSLPNLSGLAMLSTANLIMIAVMTMGSLRMEQLGSGLSVIGLVISVHIAGMFLPSSLSGRLTSRIGGTRSCLIAAPLLALACLLAAVAESDLAMAAAMLLLGAAWNLALLAGSALITDGVPEGLRPRREGWGDTSMGLAAAGGGIVSGPVMHATNYATLAAASALLAVVFTAVVLAITPTARR